MPTSEVVTLMRRFKTDIARAGSSQQAEMARRWLAVERRLSGQIDALALRMTAVHEAGGTVTVNMLMNEVRYQELLIQLHEEQAKYTVYAERTITNGQEQLAAAGISHAEQAIAAQVATSFNRLPVSAVEHMVGLTGAGTPLNSLLVQSWPLSAQGLTQALVDGVALGWGPRKTAKMMAEGMTGSLDRMLTIARTEQLRTYRESSFASYKESGIVTGYRRLCAHDRRTCAACIMDEGHVYDLDEEMPEHPNGRCAMIPVVKGAPPTEWLKGEEWFEQQDAAVQQDILGKGHYAGWKNGQFALQDVVKVTPNSTWGPSLGVTPLKELAGQAGRVALPPVSLQPAPVVLPSRIPPVVQPLLPSDIANNLPATGRLSELADESLQRLARNEEARNAPFEDKGLSGRLANMYADAKKKTGNELVETIRGTEVRLDRLKAQEPNLEKRQELMPYKLQRDLLTANRREETFRRAYYKDVKQLASLVEAEKHNGVIVLEQSEVRSLLGRTGDVYIDAGWNPDKGKPQYNPSLFKTSDLSGAKVRYYIEFPDGRIGHPDEINEARERGRIIIVGDIKVPARDWQAAP